MACATSVYDTYCVGYWNEENERAKPSNQIVDHFFFNLCKPFLNLNCFFLCMTSE